MLTTRILRQGVLVRRSIHPRYFSADPLKEPSKFVDGVAPEDVEKNEELAAFFKANFTREQGSATEEKKEENELVGDDAASALNIRKLHCYLRDPVNEEGSRRCETVRDNGQIPGLLYGADPTQGIHSSDPESKIFVKTPWNLLQRELDLYHRSFESRVYDLTVFRDETDKEGTIHRVLPANVNRHPVQHKLFCANFLRYHPGRPIKLPIVYLNEEESPALKRGGFIAPINRYVRCLVEDGVAIPEFLELECTGLELKEVVRLDRIIVPDGVKVSKLVKQDHFIIGTVFGRRGDKSDDDDE